MASFRASLPSKIGENSVINNYRFFNNLKSLFNNFVYLENQSDSTTIATFPLLVKLLMLKFIYASNQILFPNKIKYYLFFLHPVNPFALTINFKNENNKAVKTNC